MNCKIGTLMGKMILSACVFCMHMGGLLINANMWKKVGVTLGTYALWTQS